MLDETQIKKIIKSLDGHAYDIKLSLAEPPTVELRKKISGKISSMKKVLKRNQYDVDNEDDYLVLIDTFEKKFRDIYPKQQKRPASGSSKMHSCFNKKYQDSRIEIPYYNNVTIARR